MCHMGSRKGKIQPQMAVSGNADIFSIKVDSRLKTILIHTGVIPEINFSSVFLQKYICSPNCGFRERKSRGMHKIWDQLKPPLKVGQSGWKFYRKLSLYQRMICIILANSRATLQMSILGCGGHQCHPSRWKCQVYHNIANLKLKFNFMHILIINEDILGTFGALHVWPEIISANYCSKYSQK